ncbi:vacuolar protein sorting-associated protein 13D-like isoform X2 [Acanthaster planci]|uniref:Vacuolar protein sorting-associated protein 13D-like isoform X2 n=1 Tax=Acanthaster planci TaxID=133434 RepID=A0A8B7YAG0_ACAPL|nr:vacuolar protein sorting-associated protein 13D-like isoform X2 [Acanthaster planci]
MLEGLAAWVLNTYVGEYVENLNTDQLSIGLLSGAVELENLPLRKDALKNLDLPIEVKAGFIGKISLQIPVRHIKSEPCVISIDSLYLVAGPAGKASYDEERENQAKKDRNRKQLEALESQWKAKFEKSQPEAGSSWYAYSTSLFYNVLENIQLKVRDVHIRYEDSTTVPNESFAFGITIKSLSAQSTDENWKARIVQGEEGAMRFKLLQLENFAIYWDTNIELYGDLDINDLRDALQKREVSVDAPRTQHDFLIQPVSAEAKLRRNGSPLPLRSRSTPRFICDVNLQKIPLSLSGDQYHGMIALAREFERSGRARLYRKWRPKVPIQADAKKWWNFAITSILHSIKERNKRRSPGFISERIRKITCYIKAYTKILEGSTPDKELKACMEEMENDLEFEELRLLRELTYGQVEKRIAGGEEFFKKPDQEASQQQGLMQRWVWGWGGWYSGGTASTDQTDSVGSTTPAGLGRASGSLSPLPIDEQELMDVIGDPMADSTLLKRDHVFALLNLNLQGGSFKLCSAAAAPMTQDSAPTPSKRRADSMAPIIELEFAGVKMSLESRLRTSSMLFRAKLGALYVRDVMTKGSLFPLLVSPQQRRDEGSGTQSRQTSGILAKTSSSYMAQSAAYKRQSSEETLFEMSYESNPPNSNADCRLEIITRPLDMVYNPSAMQRISDFFDTSTAKARGLASRPSELHLTRMARLRYEELKNQTKQELRHTLDTLLEGEQQSQVSRWDVHLDISAPQIIIPDSFHSKDAMLVVLDFGHLQLASATAKANYAKKPKAEDASLADDSELDLDDDFLTPPSTPPNESSADSPSGSAVVTGAGPVDEGKSDLQTVDFGSAVTESSMRERMYDRYNLNMSDLQVLVGKATDNWRIAHTKGSGHMQVIEKFTISVKVERRLMFTTDPQWPSAVVSGNLPTLAIHINEQKIQALNICMKVLTGPSEGGASPASAGVTLTDDLSAVNRTHTTSLSEMEATLTQRTQALLEESKLLEMQFSVDLLSLSVESRGRCIAECQVYGVQANFAKQPYNTSVSLTVHGLLLIDALQQFGPEFELLVASHRDLSMHAASGSIVDSEHSTPRSAQSPTSSQSPASPVEKMMDTSSQSVLASALSAMGKSISGVSISGKSSSSQIQEQLYADSVRHTETDTVGQEAAEALITVEIELISADCPSNINSSREALQIASVQFNNLDVIANQETVVELLSFFHRAFPHESKEPPAKQTLQGDASAFELEISSTKTEVTADFHRLNVVLVRGETDQQKHVIGRKVATATVSAAHVWATLGGDFHLEGSLGGLQLLDVTPEGSKHKTVFSVGRDPQTACETSTSTIVPPRPVENDLYQAAMEQTSIGGGIDMEDVKAFSFTLRKMEGGSMLSPLSAGSQTPGFSFGNGDSQTVKGFQLTLHLASLVYTHVPRFLHDITLCVDEFQSSAAALADSIQKAAAGVAMDFVRQKSDVIASVASPMLYSTRIETPICGMNQSAVDTTDSSVLEEKPSTDFKFKMTMETPIIIIPRSAISSEVLIAHLGKISITNTPLDADTTLPTPSHGMSPETTPVAPTTRLFLGMRDIKVSSFNHLDSKSRSSSFVSTDSADSGSNIKPSLYKGTPILHDTSLELTINLLPVDPAAMPSNYSLDTMGSDDSFLQEERSPTTLVSGRIVSPLKVILSKHVYEQILQTMDNLTFKEVKEVEPKRTPSMASTPVSGGLFMWTVDPPDNQPHPDAEAATLDESAMENAENENKDSHTKIKVDFHLPEFSVEMCSDTCDGGQGLVNLTFQNFSVEFENTTPHTSSISVTLHSLIMEDLIQPPFSKHRYLMVSTGGPRIAKPTPKMYHSSSCPAISSMISPISSRPGSLPSALDSPVPPRYTYHGHHYGHPGTKGVPLIPSTPPPSLSESLEDIPESKETEESFVDKNALMRIKVMLVDRDCPEFVTKYKRVNRFVDVTFNALETTINLQTWVVLLDFLGIGGPAPKSRASPEEKALLRMKRKAAAKAASSKTDDEAVSSTIEFRDEVNTEMVIQVGSLSLLLNKPDYELAKANVSNVSTHLLLMDGNMDVSGRLGRMSLLDLTPHGKLYRERFTTKGQEALSFSIFKYGQPDPNLDREFDLSIKLRMSSVRYVHTNRFQMETVAFAQHFNQLQEVLGTMRAATDGIQVKEDPKRASRISMDIEAGSPVCIAPISSKSKDVLVMNLGNLTLKNEFLLAGSPGTIAKLPSKVATDDVQFSKDSTCLLDCMHLDLVDMDLFSAERVEPLDFDAREDSAMIFPSFVICRKGGRLLKDTCQLRLQVDRNLDADITRAVPDFSVSGMLSSVHCSLDVTQYQLIRGMLDHNLGEKLEEFEAMQRTQNPVNQTVLSGRVWTSISLNVQLVNVTLELLFSHQQGPTPERSLGKFDFIESRFSFESFSDTTKTIDLVSHAIRASDTRWKDSGGSAKTPTNVFWEVLTPTRHHSRNPNPLQLELHYASQLDHTRATVLLNNMRVMCVMDLLLAAKDFLLDYDAKSIQSASNASGKAHGASSDGSSNQSSAPSSTTATRNKRSGTPVNVASGIFTKRAQATEKSDNPLEICLNVTETEFVVMEDTACSDSSAVILKATCAVMTYKMENKENPLSCSLEGLEVFSCCLSNEGETALSIVDPVSVNMELKANPTSLASQGHIGGLLDVMDVHRTLEVLIQALNIRVSYHDARLFLAIMNSLPAQLLQAEQEEKEDTPKKALTSSSTSKSKQVAKLQELGFSREDCKVALTKSNGELDQAASWLLENAKPVPRTLVPRRNSGNEEEGALEIAGIEVRAGSVSICLIDDCKDSDVPLIEVMLQNLHVFQKMLPNRQGTASGTLLGDYYNRSLSGWEPFIEPWKLNVEWLQQDETAEYPEKVFVQCKVNDRLDLNLTSALMNLYSNTKKNWTEDYYKTGTKEGLPARHRSPFVPYALRNLTGCNLWFATLTTNPNRVASSPTEKLASPLVSVGGAGSWMEVLPGQEVPFVFEEKGKQRHRNTHELRVHQLLVRVEGWERMAPVSVDKVGTFFRLAKPEHMHTASIFTSQRAERVLFHVTLEGSARKLVTVQSALTVVSRLNVPMDINLFNPDSSTDNPITFPPLTPNAALPIPLSHTNWLMNMRPHGWGMGLCDSPIKWQSVNTPKATDTQAMKCRLGRRDEDGLFRFWAYIRHEAFPRELAAKRSPSFSELSRKQDNTAQELQPGHTITLLPPIVLTNLLPFDLKYKMHRTGGYGNISPGKDEPIYDADLNQANDISFTMDNFPDCHTPLSLPPRLTKDAYGYILLRDSHPKKRRLVLKARVECRAGRCLKILISARYWLINKSGLPLIFKQEGADFEAAGQFEVHEQARSVAPLVFSYADSDYAEMCTMRLGRGIIGLQDVPLYCQRISLEGGSGVRSLRVAQQGGRPHMVYHIGIDIRPGRGRYHDTQIVTFVPRFQLENRSSCKLAFAQRHFVQGKGSKNPSEHLSVIAGSSVIFHWPRDDLDKLLCARIAGDSTCRWSGGMRIDQPSSFNINMRSANNQSNIMHVAVSLVGATFFVVFTDAVHVPPPYRIDNMSEVNIIYYQSKVADTNLRTVLRPKASVPYTWDELVLPRELYCEAKGGSGATYKLDTLGDGVPLYYENFIYLCLTHTCSGSSSSSLSSGLLKRRDDYTSANLVFDIVPNGKAVILRRKEPGKRSQLWRMTPTGMLQNQAFTPPRDPNKAPSGSHNPLVLDIADMAANPNSIMPLVMRKPDERRKGTQTWFFKEDGHMICHLGGLAVRAKGLGEGCEVVLGPADIRDHIPVEQAIHAMKHLPGSGCLHCKVLADGPTRVLQITDSWVQSPAQSPVSGSIQAQKDDWIYVKTYKENKTSGETRPVVRTQDTQGGTPKVKELDIVFFLRDGLGLSLVNNTPEEVLYILLSGLEVRHVSTQQEISLKVQIKNIQVDNQLTGAQKPVVLFVTPNQDDKPSVSSTPALSMVATKLPSSHEMVDIYKLLFVNLRKMTLNLEELLLLKLMQFAGFAQSDSEIEKMDESYYNSLRPVSVEQKAKRYFFETLKLNATEFKLSVLTSSKLPPDLQAIKTQQRLFMIQFEDAPVSLDPFTRLHPFETQEFLLDAVVKHYTEELKSQAVKILGSVDFLGNPIGLIQDLRDGLKELLLEGNVTGMVKNVTHGMSNTAAKVTGSISNTLGTVIMDNHHEEIRSNIRGSHDGSSTGHLKAGVKGFTFGVVGGLTSIFTQTYQGMTEDGVEGLMKGLGKGVIGTVAKPVAGVMDLASGTMAALRSSTSGESHLMPNKVRLTRCCINPAGMLPRYSAYNARGQEYMQKLSESSNGKERFFSMETLRSSPTEGMEALITSEWTYFLPINDPLSPVLQVMHSELFHARHIQQGSKHYIELTKMASTEAGVSTSRYDLKERPKVGCDNDKIAKKVSQQINYAKGCYEELKLQVMMDTSDSNLKLELAGNDET